MCLHNHKTHQLVYHFVMKHSHTGEIIIQTNRFNLLQKFSMKKFEFNPFYCYKCCICLSFFFFTFNSARDPSKLNTAYLFFSFFPSSFEAGRIMARQGPSTSKKMEFSLRTEYFRDLTSSNSWYWSLVKKSYNRSRYRCCYFSLIQCFQLGISHFLMGTIL